MPCVGNAHFRAAAPVHNLASFDKKAICAELTDHLGYEKNDPAGRGTGNSRNGHSTKRLKGEDGELEVAVPRTATPRSIPGSSARARGGLTASTTR